MKIFVWNIQGIGDPQTSNSLLSLVNTHDPDILFLLETKLEKQNAMFFMKKLGFVNVFTVDRVSLSGGLMLLWKEQCVVNVISYSNF